MKNVKKKAIFILFLFIFLVSCEETGEEPDDKNKTESTHTTKTVTEVMGVEDYGEWQKARAYVYTDQLPETAEENEDEDVYYDLTVPCTKTPPNKDLNSVTTIVASEVVDPDERAVQPFGASWGGTSIECGMESDDTIVAECQMCNIRMRPHLAEGVILTCFECAHQQADKTCGAGTQQKGNSQYRVSAQFFEVILPEKKPVDTSLQTIDTNLKENENEEEN